MVLQTQLQALDAVARSCLGNTSQKFFGAMTKQWAKDRATVRGRDRGLGSRQARTRLYDQFGTRLVLALQRDPPDLDKAIFIFGQAERAWDRLPESKFILRRNQRKVNVNTQNQYGRTALMYCAMHAQDDDRYWDISQLILNEQGVNVRRESIHFTA